MLWIQLKDDLGCEVWANLTEAASVRLRENGAAEISFPGAHTLLITDAESRARLRKIIGIQAGWSEPRDVRAEAFIPQPVEDDVEDVETDAPDYGDGHWADCAPADTDLRDVLADAPTGGRADA